MNLAFGPWETIVVVGVFLLLLTLVGIGIYCIVRYFQTRETRYLIIGLVLSLVLPGLLVCCLVMVLLPATMVTYGPPPSPGP